VAIASETTSVNGFKDAFQGGEVYLDPGNAFKKALGNRRAGYSSLLAPSMWQSASRAKVRAASLAACLSVTCAWQSKYPEMPSDLKGDGFGLGGLLLVKRGVPGRVAYLHEEKSIGDIADMSDVLAALVDNDH
jgi:hypothetical protein